MFGQEREDGIDAFLQVALGIDQPIQRRRVACGGGIAPQRLAGRFALDFAELVLNLARAAVEGHGQRGVEPGHLAAQPPHGALHGCHRIVDRFRQRGRD